MQWVLIVTLLLYSIIDLRLLRAFTIKKEKTALRASVTSLVFVWSAFLATYFFDFYLPSIAFFFIMLSFLNESYFGFYLNLYNKATYFDRIAHGVGAFSAAIFAYYFFSNFFLSGGSSAFRAFYIFLLGVSAGAVYEIIEFVIDLNHDKKLQRGLRDTDFDLISDIVGAIAAAIFAFFVLL